MKFNLHRHTLSLSFVLALLPSCGGRTVYAIEQSTAYNCGSQAVFGGSDHFLAVWHRIEYKYFESKDPDERRSPEQLDIENVSVSCDVWHVDSSDTQITEGGESFSSGVPVRDCNAELPDNWTVGFTWIFRSDTAAATARGPDDETVDIALQCVAKDDAFVEH